MSQVHYVSHHIMQTVISTAQLSLPTIIALFSKLDPELIQMSELLTTALIISKIVMFNFPAFLLLLTLQLLELMPAKTWASFYLCLCMWGAYWLDVGCFPMAVPRNVMRRRSQLLALLVTIHRTLPCKGCMLQCRFYWVTVCGIAETSQR